MALYEDGAWLATRKRARAVEPQAASLAIRDRLGDRLGVAQCLESIAQAARESCSPGDCVELVGAAARIRDELEAPLPERRRRQMQGCMEAVTAELGEPAFEERMRSGGRLPDAEAVERALQFCSVAAAR